MIHRSSRRDVHRTLYVTLLLCEAGAYGTHSFLARAPRWEYLIALLGRRSIVLSGGTGDPADSYRLGTFQDA